MDAFLELSFELAGLDPAAAECACLASGATAVTFSDDRDEPVLEPLPGELRLWPHTRVRALFPRATEPLAALLGLARALGCPAERIRARAIPDRAWEREWLRDFHAMRFGRRLWICPQHERVSDTDAVVVRLDPGMAFGTGTHASTALCLEWLDAQAIPAGVAIDYGCGSGILGIAAARLGARAVHAFDIDPQALEATRQNAQRNGVAAQLQVHESAATLPAIADLVLANILAEPLCALAADFAARTAAGGEVVLAGLLAAQVAQVTAAYGACFDVTMHGAREGWACLVGRRRAG